MPFASAANLRYLWRVLNTEAHVRLQSYSPDMNDVEFRDYAEAVRALWIVERALGKDPDLTWRGSARIGEFSE